MRSLLASLLVLSAAGVALADVVVMKDGRQLQGRSTVEGDEVVIRQKHGEVRVPRDEVLKIERQDDVYSQLARKEKELAGGTADDRYQLGVWARDHKLDDEARAAFLSVLKVDPDHAGARAALGYVLEGGRWLTEEDQMRARGMVKFQGRWMTPADKIRAEADNADKLAKAREAVKKAEEDKLAARAAKLQAERDARLARIQTYEEELARARARRQAAEEAEPLGFSSVTYGPYGGFGRYGLVGGPIGYSYYVGPRNLSNRDILIYAGYQSGRYRYGNGRLAVPARGGFVTLGAYGTGYGCNNGGWGSGYYGSQSYSSYGYGVQLQGSWTSKSGKAQVRFRTGF